MAYESQVNKYGRNSVPQPGNPAHNEAWALIECARRIAGVVQYGNFDRPEDKRKMRDALRLNLRIWTIIQAEQTVNENQLPDPIRQNILTLCKFIDRHTLDTMIEPTAERAVVLININRNIAAGLLGSTEDALDGDEEASDEIAIEEPQKPQEEPIKIEI